MIPLVCAYAALHPDTAAALAGEDVEWADTSGSDDAYYWLLRTLWQEQAGAILVEQDIVPYPGAIASLRACPERWCGVPYTVGRTFGVWHGLTKYAPEIMAAHPYTLRLVRDHHWRGLDSAVIALLRAQGERPHWHWPAAEHRNPECAPPEHVFANCQDCGGPLRFAELRAGPGASACSRCGRPVYYFGHGGAT